MQVTENTPPTYITHSADDKLVDVENSIFFEALRHKNVPVECYISQRRTWFCASAETGRMDGFI